MGLKKSRRVLPAKRKSLVHEHGKGTEQAAKATDENEEDALFEAGEFGVCTFLFVYKLVLKSWLYLT